MNRSEATALLREAVKLNVLARGNDNRFSEERDEVVAELQAAGYPANYAVYSHPMDVDQ